MLPQPILLRFSGDGADPSFPGFPRGWLRAHGYVSCREQPDVLVFEYPHCLLPQVEANLRISVGSEKKLLPTSTLPHVLSNLRTQHLR